MAGFTLASAGFRHVARMYFDGFDAISNCLTNPKPRPRLQPVIKNEVIVAYLFQFPLVMNFTLYDK